MIENERFIANYPTTEVELLIDTTSANEINLSAQTAYRISLIKTTTTTQLLKAQPTADILTINKRDGLTQMLKSFHEI